MKPDFRNYLDFSCALEELIEAAEYHMRDSFMEPAREKYFENIMLKLQSALADLDAGVEGDYLNP